MTAIHLTQLARHKDFICTHPEVELTNGSSEEVPKDGWPLFCFCSEFQNFRWRRSVTALVSLKFWNGESTFLSRKLALTQVCVLEKLIFEWKHSLSTLRPFLKQLEVFLLLPVVFLDVFPRSAGEATTCSNNPVHLTQPPLCTLTLSAAAQ